MEDFVQVPYNYLLKDLDEFFLGFRMGFVSNDLELNDVDFNESLLLIESVKTNVVSFLESFTDAKFLTNKSEKLPPYTIESFNIPKHAGVPVKQIFSLHPQVVSFTSETSYVHIDLMSGDVNSGYLHNYSASVPLYYEGIPIIPDDVTSIVETDEVISVPRDFFSSNEKRIFSRIDGKLDLVDDEMGLSFYIEEELQQVRKVTNSPKFEEFTLCHIGKGLCAWVYDEITSIFFMNGDYYCTLEKENFVQVLHLATMKKLFSLKGTRFVACYNNRHIAFEQRGSLNLMTF